MKIKKIPKNIIAHLQECSAMVGRYEDENFNQSVWWKIEDIKSPIEQLFYTSICALAKLNEFSLYDYPNYEMDSMDELLDCADYAKECPIAIWPQYKIGSYRADFLVATQWELSRELNQNLRRFRQVVVELDGHKFHDRDEKDRRYEKRRDRFMQAKGFKVMRFTGKEVTDNPFQVAGEVLAVITNDSQEELIETIEDYKE